MRLYQHKPKHHLKKMKNHIKQVILGSNGTIGVALAKELASYSSDITLVSRNPRKVNPTDRLLPLDLSHKENIKQAIGDADRVYITIGFPYKTSAWKKLWLPFMQEVISVCSKNRTKLVFFDNIYAIGKEGIHHIVESSVIGPSSKKGEIRAAVDRLLIQTMNSGNLDVIIARAPDFFGGNSGKNSILMNLVYDQLKLEKKAKWFCDAGKVHSFGYVPDLAKGMALLGNTDAAYNQIWNLPTSTEKLTGKDWISLFAEQMQGSSNYMILPNWILKTAGIFVPMMREVAEMNYQYDRDYFFDSSRFNAYFNYTPTSSKEAVKQTLQLLSVK